MAPNLDLTVNQDLEEWKSIAKLIFKSLKLDINTDDPAILCNIFLEHPIARLVKSRVYQFYIPLYHWMLNKLRMFREKEKTQPIIIGLQSIQGCGKSTLVEIMRAIFTHMGFNIATLSLDDFYLTHSEQKELSLRYSNNPLLQSRGNALTHDLNLANWTLSQLQNAKPCDNVPIPRYEKQIYNGMGDRANDATWPTVSGPVDLILLEGWMLGFSPADNELVTQISKHLIPINNALHNYVKCFNKIINCWIILKVEDASLAYSWRLEAEKANGANGMNNEEIKKFVERYMPAYKLYLPFLYDNGPLLSKPNDVLCVSLDNKRGLLN